MARIGRLTPIANTKRKFGSSPIYYHVAIQRQSRWDPVEHWLLTEDEARLARKRGLDNPEDMPQDDPPAPAAHRILLAAAVGLAAAGILLLLLK